MASELITISPIDDTELLRRPYTSQADIAATLVRAKSAQRDWRERTLADRCAAVSAAVDQVMAGKDEMARAITQQMGRPIRYTPSELNGFEERARYMIGAAADALAPVKLPEKESFVRYITREPVGTVLTIAPWNYPLMTAVNSIVPALVAGNTVILKHSDQTPLCAELLHHAFARSGLPEGVFQFVHATHDTIAQMMASPDVNYVSFTGSVPGGKAVEQACTGRFIGSGLELGGCDPAYVRADADLGAAVESLVDGAFFNSGQSCCGIQRIYVAKGAYGEFVERAAQLTRQYVLGDPLNPATTMGPVVRTRAAREIRDIVQNAVDQGARNVVDPALFAAAQDDNAYVAPAMLVNVDHSMGVMNEECFGPVVGIMPVDSDEQAIGLMNDSRYGLTAAVFTQDLDAAVQIGNKVQAGTFFMNRCDYLDPALAWTGVKNSGHGVSLSSLGYQPLTQVKSFHLRTL